MAIVTIKCDGDQSVHNETLRIRRVLTELGLVPVSVGPGTVRNLKLTFALEFKTAEEGARFHAAIGDKPAPQRG